MRLILLKGRYSLGLPIPNIHPFKRQYQNTSSVCINFKDHFDLKQPMSPYIEYASICALLC